MQQILIWTLAALLAPVFALAEGCPPPHSHEADISRLLEQIQAAPDANAARLLSNELWTHWATAPDEPAQEILDRGLKKRAAQDLLGALQDFDALIAYCPDYAEGYNQRGFIAFIQQDYASALRDLDMATALDPRHVGALSGRALTLMQMGRNREAHRVLSAALALNPWLPERRFLEQMSAPDKTDL